MSNIRDGGDIIIGMEKQSDDTYIAKGMEQSHLDSYTNDNVASFISERADPYVRFTLTKQEDDSGQQYVWIRVEEFEETPVICRKSYGQTLGGGKVYTRTRRFPESAEVPSSAEMREIIEMATEKRIRAFIQQANRAGIPLTTPTVPTAPTAEEAFDKQLEGIFS
jgi:predicted HTH transcriptional regulator